MEVSHEALIRGWPRLQRWVEEDRGGLRVHRRLTAAAAEWERLGRDEGVLYRGAQLAEATAWEQRHPDAANPLERAFLEAGLTAEESQRRRRLRRLHLVTTALAVGMIIVSGLAVTASRERNRAEEQRRLALSRRVAAEAVNQLSIEPALGLALAVEAVEVASTREAVAALRQALVTPHPRLELPGGRQDFTLDPTGSQVVVGDEDGMARVWDLQTGAVLQVLEGHAGKVIVTSFSPDGRWLVTTDEQGARIWDAASGSLLHVLGHGRGVYGVSWSPDGQQIVTASFEDVIRVWDVATGRQSTTIGAPTAVSFAHWTPDGEAVLAWSAMDPQLYLFDVSTGKQLAVLQGHDDAAVDARVSPDGQYAVSVGLDSTARIWDLRAGKEVAELDEFSTQVWTARFNTDGSLIIVGDAAGTVRVAEVPTGRTRFDLRAHTDAVVGAEFSPSGAVAATVSADGTALVWDVDTGQTREILKLNGAAPLGLEARTVIFTPDGQRLLTRAATVQVWDVPAGPDMVLRGHETYVGALALSRDGKLLATGSQDGTLRVWDMSNGDDLWTRELAESQISAASFSPNGGLLATANPIPPAINERTVPPTMWDVSTGGRVRHLPVPAPTHPPCPLVCQTSFVAYSPDGTTLLTAGQEGVVRLWDPATGELLRALQPANRQLRAISSSPDSRWIAGAGWRTVPVWDVATGELARILPAHGIGVAFSPAGDLLAVAGDDGVASIWEPATGHVVGELRHPSAVAGVAWSHDGRFVLTAAGDGAHLWDVASQQQIQEFTGHGGAGSVAFARDGLVVVATADGTVHFHRCAVCGSDEDLLQMARDRIIRELSPVERQRFLHEVGDR
ncbi:MAG: WD40 repeat domain-containing protein [Actinobacteria bacterium]|nr:WD40 repeat domain-containing protein [Actinomycetota bacterium]